VKTSSKYGKTAIATKATAVHKRKRI